MATPLLHESLAAFKASFAAELGCELSAFEEPALTVVERPASSRDSHLVLITECGVGTVVSVKDARLIEWITTEAAKQEAHFRVFLPSFLEGLAAEARRLGHEGARSHNPSLGMVLAEVVPLPPLAPELELVELTPEDIHTYRQTSKFYNALLEHDEPPEELARFRTAFAVKDAAGKVLGISGVWDQFAGMDEVGVDVTREARGHGLARPLTIRATQWVRAQGRWPIYTFGVANIRSNNNGLACGYRPAWLLNVVFVPD